MEISTTLKWVVVSSLLLPLSLAADETSPDAFAYDVLSFNDGTGNFSGWTLQETTGSNQKSYSRQIKTTDGTTGLYCWAFQDYRFTGSSSQFPGMQPIEIQVKKLTDSQWLPITVNQDFTILPPGYDQVRATFSSSVPKAISIGPQVPNEDQIKLTGFATTVITGEVTDRGIKASGKEQQTAEVSINCESASHLTQAYAQVTYCINAIQGINDNEIESPGGYWDLNIAMTAISKSGKTTELIPITPVINTSSLNTATKCCILPSETKELRIRWTFSDVNWVIDDELLEASNGDEEAAKVYDRIYISSTTNTTTDFIDIAQRGGGTIGADRALELSLNPSTWYDVDGDGIMEWGFNSLKTGLWKFNADFKGNYALNTIFPNINSWVKYGIGDNVGAFSSHEIFSIEGTNASTLASVDAELSLIDYDNDGRLDFWLKSSQSENSLDEAVLTQATDRSLVHDRLSIMSPEEYYNYIKQNPSSGLGSGVSFVGDGPKSIPGSFDTYAIIDMNNDGYPDFIDTASGRYLMNTGDGRYVSDSFGGTVIFRDFDGDGITDMLAYDSDEKSITVYLQRRNENAVIQKLFSGLNCSSYIWCHDFDRDGDVDILVPFNGSQNSGQSYLVMFENTGNGKFKKHENYIDGNHDFHACADWNSDGLYEVLSVRHEKLKRTVNSFTVNGLKVSTTPNLVYEGTYSYKYNPSHHGSILVGDIDNTGIQRMLFFDDMFTPENAVNTRPERPAAPNVFYDPATDEVTVSWTLGNDKETAPLDLTYELRIGTAPDLGDIVWADASADGSRRNILPGNCGHALQRRFNAASWPQGSVYVSIQAIDQGGRGSLFSEYTTFEKKQPAASFVVTTPDFCAIGDTCTISMKTIHASAADLSWDFDGATIISKTAKETRIAYPTPGEKHITLTASDSYGNKASSTQTITVLPAKLIHCKHDETGLPYYNICNAFDMDLDGKTELVTPEYAGAAFFEGDSKGNYTPVKRLFNTNISAKFGKNVSHVVDINRDGLPDMIAEESASNITHFINEGDKSMQIEHHETHRITEFLDFDNDGVLDGVLNNGTLCRNTGDYVTFNGSADNIPFSTKLYFTDFNGDGLMDVICVNVGELTFFTNKGNFQFEETEKVTIESLSTIYVILDGSAIGDFDGNGKTDISWCYTEYEPGSTAIKSSGIYIRWDNGDISRIPAPAGHAFNKISHVFDYDNNGCEDLCINNYTVFLNTDHSYEITKIMDPSIDDFDVPYMRTDGTTGIGHTKLACRANTAPTAPTGLRASQNSNAVVIEWNRASDAETPATALRYNISIKHAGKEGAGAYFVSPLNDGMNGVAVPSGTLLQTSTTFTIPLSAIPAGDYEVKVQAVDTQWQQGDFSETVKFSVVASAAVDLPTATMVGATVAVRINAGFSVNDIDFGSDAVIESVVGNTANVYWTTEGLKSVTAGGFTAQIYVNPALNASFELPEIVYAGDKIRLTCDTSHPDLWEISTGILDQHINFSPVNQEKNKKAVTFTVIDDNTAEIIFNSITTWNVRHTITEDYGSDACTRRTYVQRHETEPSITLVDIDGTSGKHRLTWEIPSHLRAVAHTVNIYKESSRLGQYSLIATCPVSDNEFIDMESVPDIVASRYALSYSTSYGETMMSTTHRPIHVMINKGMAGSWNLSWDQYEGREITTYRILRGATPQTLSCIAEVSGGITSYTDTNAPSNEGYYAIEILVDNAVMRSRASSVSVSRSNVVSVADAGSIVFASHITVTSDTGSMHIAADQTSVLQLYAFISPVNASMRRVDWMVIQGSDVVKVSQDGLITATGNGTAIIRAYATDGSGVYGEATVTVSDWSGIESISASSTESQKLKIQVMNSDIVVSNIAASETSQATLRIYSLNGLLLQMLKTSSQCEVINVSALSPGVYIISSESDHAVQAARFIKK